MLLLFLTSEPGCRFLLVVPCSTEDELLLYDILQMLQLMFRCHGNAMPEEVMNWLAEMLLNPKAGFQSLLARNNAASDTELPESALLARRSVDSTLFVCTHRHT